MNFKKPNKEDLKIFAISAIFVIVIAIFSATSKSDETGEVLTIKEWLTINLFTVAFAIVIDMAIIDNREKKKKHLLERKKREEIEKERAEKEMTVEVNIKSGAIKNGICKIHQLFENSLFYFDDEIETLYEMIGYEWDGAKYTKVTKKNANRIDTGRTKVRGVADGSLGVVLGAGDARTVSNRQENGEMTEREVEEQGSAIIRMKRIQDGRMMSFVIECNSEIDKKIRCFNNILE